MANVLLVAYLLIVLAMIVVILLQRSEGGALGIGGGGGGFMTARGSANLLTRTTAILAALFFATAIGLTVLNEFDRGTSGILERATEGETPSSVLDALDSLQGGSTSDLPAPPAQQAPAEQTTAPTDIDALDLAVPDTPAQQPAEETSSGDQTGTQTPAAPSGN
ncbi:preprotein translocase subunit SecG [Devosia nitrariae]|uniref:Protein-export membrane protein SecG n=1 Tax=Devosia nitrariae TaxID=2071872 RepID=A0ABQ5WDE6_9HYPH|nr:preprotein translocase subunit SecG [Devosia nitrariae]GLQ57794.1 preprotein translocase subunit SecG [Devosia nitrariae]